MSKKQKTNDGLTWSGTDGNAGCQRVKVNYSLRVTSCLWGWYRQPTSCVVCPLCSQYMWNAIHSYHLWNTSTAFPETTDADWSLEELWSIPSTV